MSDHPRPTKTSRLLAFCYPRELREQYADDIARFIDDTRLDARYRDNPLGRAHVMARLSADALASLFSSWRHGAPRPIRVVSSEPSLGARLKTFSVDALLQDIKFAIRGFIRRPAFTAVALGTLTLGIGANTTIFTLVNALLLRPLPYAHPEQLVSIWATSAAQKQLLISLPDAEDFRARNRAFSDIGLVRTISVNLTGGDRPDRVVGSFITASTLRLLNAKTAAGRLFTDDETALDAGQQVVVLSNAAWMTRFGGRKDALGKTMVLNGRPHVIIGVTAADFQDPYEADLWLPVSSAPSRTWFDRTVTSVWAVGRLKPGLTARDGQKDLASIFTQLEGEHPQNAGVRPGVTVIDLREQLVGDSRFMLIVLFGAVVAVLLIVCVNLANLQLIRASTRAREISLRAALGANRARLAMQVVVESLLLSLAGGALGVLLGMWAVKALAGVLPIPAATPLHVDAWVLGFSLVIAVLTGLLFGAPAAMFGSRVNLQDALRARTESATARRFNARNALVVAELSLCIVLLAVAGLFTRSLVSLQRTNTGFDIENVLTAEFRLPSMKYDDSSKVELFMAAALERLRGVPGVASVALVDAIPLSGNFGTANYVAQGHAQPAPGAESATQITSASDGYFRTMHIPQLAGRDFDSHDKIGTERVAIVNQEFARKEWPGESAIGKSVRLLGQGDLDVRVVGVVGNIKMRTLSETNTPQLYLDKMQGSGIFASVAMRTVGDAEAMGNALREAIWSVDPDQPVWKVRTIRALVKRDLSQTKLSVNLIGAFAALALILGVIGVYGVMSFSVAQRTREVGIRMALGARGVQAVRLVMRSGLEVVIVAVAVGVVGALAAGRYLESKLYNVGASDPATMLTVPVLLALVAMVACWLPARRAARVDPASTLRND
ncbi:MAG TPA: ABC transporter permease [Gemmatimonadaceae bacterium]|nr:ABC transporter permease [Gemmatimonadaceae bacterium]